MIRKERYAPEGKLTCESCIHFSNCRLGKSRKHEFCWEPNIESKQGEKYYLDVQESKEKFTCVFYAVAVTVLLIVLVVSSGSIKLADDQFMVEEGFETVVPTIRHVYITQAPIKVTPIPNPKTTIEAKVENALSSLSSDWEITCRYFASDGRIHVALHHLRLSRFDKEWKNGAPHSKIARKAANAAFSVAEAESVGCWVSVAVAPKDSGWESYRWSSDKYQNGSVTTNGFLNGK